MKKVTKKRKPSCEFHLYARHTWHSELIDFTEMKIINEINLSPGDFKKTWIDILSQYRNGLIVAGWDEGKFTFHPVVKESR